MSIKERLAAYIRTAVPAAVGALLAYLVAKVPVVADAIAIIDQFLEDAGFAGWTVAAILYAVSSAGAVTGYYWLARKLGERFPAVEKWLLGSSLVPIYVDAPAVVIVQSGPGIDTGFETDQNGFNAR